MADEKVMMDAWGLGVMYRPGVNADESRLHDVLISARGFLGWDDKEAMRCYFFIAEKIRDEMKADLDGSIALQAEAAGSVAFGPIRFAIEKEI